MTNCLIQTEIDLELKTKVEKRFAELGLTLQEAIQLFLSQAVQPNAWPLIKQPNAETQAAIDESYHGQLKAYQSLDHLWAELGQE
jgi:addiction module RelB/DinJ family antitoxin